MSDQADRLCKMLSLTGALSFEEVCKAAADRIAELEDEKQSKLWPMIQDRVYDRLITERDNLQAHVAELKAAIRALPVEEWVERDSHGDPYLVGYVMQAQGEWDAVLRLLENNDG
jgi:hypothetical protein